MILSRLLYWIVIKPISWLPYPLLYGLSDVLFFVFYYLVGYRKKVVTDNLRGCFPEYSEREIMRIRKGFYRHFCDLVLESLKNFSISSDQAQKRIHQSGLEVFDRLHAEGRSVILCGGHYCNWELWALAAPFRFKHHMMAIYKRLSNKYFDHKMRISRGRFGLEMVATKDTGQYFKDNTDRLIVSVFAIDQSPSNPQKALWIRFFGRETAALFGAEKYAKDYNYPIVFGHFYRIKRGYYGVHYELVTEQPRDHAYGEITAKMHEILEADIRKAPEYWLWSHKRWKHKRPEDKKIMEILPSVHQ